MHASRRWLVTALVILVAFLFASSANCGQMRISHQWAPEIDARDRAARIFVAELHNRLPQTKISIHPQSSLGIKPLEQYQALLGRPHRDGDFSYVLHLPANPGAIDHPAARHPCNDGTSAAAQGIRISQAVPGVL